MKTWLDWFRLGFTPIPIQYKEKRPLIRWSLWDKPKRVSFSKVKREFGKHKTHNIGVLCGNGKVVLDFDKPLPYHKFVKRTSIKSFTVKTRRGYHVYLDVESPPKKSFHFDGCDIKTSGYVVAPYSIHPSGFEYHVINDCEIVRVSNLELLGFVCKEKPRKKVDYKNPTPPLYGDSLIANVKRALSIVKLISQHTKIRSNSCNGNWYMAVCPFHDDNKESLWINSVWGKCKCFAEKCVASSKALDVIDAYSLLNYGNLSKQSIKSSLAELAFELGM